MKIGERIRTWHREMGLSLRELGQRTNVSASFLSQVENDQASPSLNSLQSIATALQVPIFCFLNDAQGGEIVRTDKRRQLAFADSKIGYDLLTPDFSRKMIAFIIRMEPHALRVALPLAKRSSQREKKGLIPANWDLTLQSQQNAHKTLFFSPCFSVTIL